MSNFWFSTITKSSPKIKHILVTMVFLTSLVPVSTKKVVAQTVLSCDLEPTEQKIINTASANYSQTGNINNQKTTVSNVFTLDTTGNAQQAIKITNQGIEDEEGKVLNALGAIADSLIDKFKQQGLNEEVAKQASVATLSEWASLSADASSMEVATAIKQSSIDKVGAEQADAIEQIPDSQLLTALSGLQAANLKALGLSDQEAATASQAEIIPQTEGSLTAQIETTTAATAASINRPEAQTIIREIQAQSAQELDNIRQGNQNIITPGSILRFRFRLDNQSEAETTIRLPNVQTLAEKGLTGSGEVTGVIFNLSQAQPEDQKTIVDTAENVSIPGKQSLELEVQVQVTEVPAETISTIGVDLQSNCGEPNTVQALNILPAITPDENKLIDPRGKISGCAGELLADYLGFSVGLFDVDPSDPTQSEAGNITPLTTTELPDDPNNNIPEGIKPNIENSNPFFLTNSDEGKYSFLFDEEAGQLDKGRNYILVVDPGEDSIYDQRRIKITIGDRQARVVEYTATSLDGRPITASDDRTSITGEIVLVKDAERVGLNLAVLDLSTNICDAEEISITKTGDRAAAEPGNIVLYRIAIRNLASAPLTNFQVRDTLPIGFRLEADSVSAEVGSEIVNINTVSQSDRQIEFSATDVNIPVGGVLNLIYAAQVTPDALRGEGENSAIVNAQRADNNFTVKDGPAIHALNIEPGIIQNSGTLIGRVFVDKNFDGEQQRGEPGVPNAVIYLEDGNRIITDADGLFSVTSILPGNHTGTLDLTSIPEYSLAPNLRFSEANSKSRLVHLEPSGMARMNFAVTPTAGEKKAGDRRKIPSSPTKTPKNES